MGLSSYRFASYSHLLLFAAMASRSRSRSPPAQPALADGAKVKCVASWIIGGECEPVGQPLPTLSYCRRCPSLLMLEDTPPPELPALRRRLEKLRQWDRERRFAELAKALDDSALVQLFIPAADEEGGEYLYE